MNNDSVAKYLVGGLCVAAFLGVTVWLVRGEARRTRQSVQEATKDAGKEVRQGIVEGAERAVDKAGQLPAKILREAKDVVLGSPGDSNSDAEAETTSQEEPSSAEEPEESPRKPTDVVGELFEFGHEVSKSLDVIGQRVLGLSLQEEVELGREVHQLVREDHQVLASSPQKPRLERLAGPLLVLRDRKGLKFTFVVLDAPQINAFAHVGGYVYVNRGMLDFATSDAELQFVLAHEIGHVDQKHCTKQITYAARVAEAGGKAAFGLAQLAYMAIALGYSEENEFQADAWGLRSMVRIGHSREEALAFPRRLLKHLEKEGREPEPYQPQHVVEATAQEVANHFRTHPPMQQRLKRLESLKIETVKAP